MTLSQLVANLRKRGHTVQVARPRQKSERQDFLDTDESLTVRGAPIPRYPDLRFGLPCSTRLKRSWSRFQPDIIHVATEGPLGLSAIRSARRLGIPCTSTFHTNFHEYAEHYQARILLKMILGYLRWIHNQTRCTMYPTQQLADALGSCGFRNNETFGRGVDLEAFNPGLRDPQLRRDWGADDDSPVIVHVSRFSAEKNYELLFKTYQAIRDAHPNARFVVVGDGPVRKKWERAFPGAVYTGMIPLDQRSELGRIYASADVFLYPSVTETYGNVLTEAMACGNACLAYNYAAANQHIATGDRGIPIDLHDEDTFIERSIALVGDPARRTTLGHNAAAYANERLDWRPVVDTFERILDHHALKRESSLAS